MPTEWSILVRASGNPAPSKSTQCYERVVVILPLLGFERWSEVKDGEVENAVFHVGSVVARTRRGWRTESAGRSASYMDRYSHGPDVDYK